MDPASHVVKAARQELEVMGLRNSEMSIATRFTVSGCPQQFAELSQQWLGFTPMVEKISLPCLSSFYPQPLEVRD